MIYVILSLKYTKDLFNLCKKKIKKDVKFFNPYDNALSLLVKNLIYCYYLTISLSSAICQKKIITSYLDNDYKATIQEKGYLPVKDTIQNISLSFAGARFDFAS